MIPVTRHGRRHVPPLPSLRPKATTAGHGGGSVHVTGFAGRSRRQRRSRHRLCKPVTAAAALTPQETATGHGDTLLMPQALQAGHGGSTAHATGISGRPRRQRRSCPRHFRPSTAAAPLTPQATAAGHGDSAAHATGISGRPRQQRRSRQMLCSPSTSAVQLLPQAIQPSASLPLSAAPLQPQAHH